MLDDQAAQRHHDASLAWVRTPPPGNWALQAACSGLVGIEFVDPHGDEMIALARGVCEHCPVLGDCEHYARRAHAWGMWGGQLRKAGKPPN